MSVKTIDKGWRRLQRELARASGKVIEVGIPEAAGAQTIEGSSSVTLATLGAFHEYGTATVPARPWLSSAITPADARRTNQRIAQDITRGMSAEAALKRAGEREAERVREQLGEGVAPLDPKTAARKGSARPLVETGALRDAIGYTIDAEKRGDS